MTGVNIIESPETMYRMSNLGFLSPDGKCFSFDSRANGYSRGEGVGTVLLKPLSAAIRDGDTIRAVVRGTGVNQDGRGTGGMTLPNKAAQEALIREVYDRFGLDLNTTGFVEAHATGTPAGDPLEAGAIASTWQGRAKSGPEAPLYVGAGKTNHGHLEGASGVAAIIKTVLSLEAGLIPPNINFEKCNPRIPLDRWGIKLPLEPTPWETSIRRASINSFGFGGTNAHVVLDDAKSYLGAKQLTGRHLTRLNGHPKGLTARSQKAHRVFILSAHDEDGIKRMFKSYSDHLQGCNISDEEAYLDSLAYTLAERRSRMAWRVAVTADSLSELIATLEDPSTKSLATRPNPAVTPSLGYVFTGQGAQWHAMGRELTAYETFRKAITAADEYLATLMDASNRFNVLEELGKSADETRLDEPLFSQTLCTVLQVALVDLLASWSVLPVRVVGHSSGEIAAAYAAGALSRESAWRVAYCRGIVSSKSVPGARGAMLAVGASPEEVRPLIDQVTKALGDGELVIACYNSPKSVTISGDEAKIDALRDIADARKFFARKLKVANAYHSSHMRPVADQYRIMMGDLQPGKATGNILVFSSVDGRLINPTEMSSAEYWVKNLVSPVKFNQALAGLCTANVTKTKLKVGGGAELPVTHIIEVGPHAALQSAVRDTVLTDPNLKAIRYLSVLSRNKHAASTALSAVGQLAAAGYPVSLCAVNHQLSASLPGMLVDLPPYPFNHSATQEYWVESRRSHSWRFRQYGRHDLLGSAVPDWNPEQPQWRNHLRVAELPWLKDHRVTGSIVLPGVSYLIMAIEGTRQLYLSKDETLIGFNLRDISISRALQISEDDDTEVMLSMRHLPESGMSDSSNWWEWKVTSFSPHDESWLEHCRGQISAETSNSSHVATGIIDNGREAREKEKMFSLLRQETTAACLGSSGKSIDLGRQYADLERVGLEFGPLFRNLTEVKAANPGVKGKVGQAMGSLRIPNIAESMPAHVLADHIIHAPVFDSLIHLFLFAFQASSTGAGKSISEPMVPVAIKSLWISADIESKPGSELKCHSSAWLASHKRFGADITVWSGAESHSKDADAPVRLVLRGLEAVPLQEGSSSAVIHGGERQICFNMAWKPDLDILEIQGGNQLQNCLREAVKPLEQSDDANLHRLKDLQLAAAIFITEAIEELESKPLGLDAELALPPHQNKYLAWLRKQAALFHNDQLIHQTSEWKAIKSDRARRDAFLHNFEHNSGPEGVLTTRMGRNIIPVLRGEADALHLMFGMDDLLEQYYRVILGTDKVHALLTSYLDLYSHKQGADLEVLEIGAGTGGTSTAALEALCPSGSRINGDARLLRYTYTDISAGFFEKAAIKFKKWKASGLVEFKVLDIEKDVDEQGFDEGTFDIIIAANVLHATSNLSRTLGNALRLLKPGGKLILQEITQPEFVAGPLCFGQLPGWWLSEEEFRPWGPLLSNSGWEEVLTHNGFVDNVLALSDVLSDDLHAQSLVVATTPEAPIMKDVDSEDAITDVFIVTRSNAEGEETILNEAAVAAVRAADCRPLGQQIRMVPFSELPLHKLKPVCCIVTLEAFAPFLSTSFSSEEFEILRQLVTTAGSLIWITGDPYEHPDMALVTGLMRTLRWERDLDGSDLVTLALTDVHDTNSTIQHITSVYKRHVISGKDRHAEYLVPQRNKVLHSNRLVSSPQNNAFIASRTTQPIPQPQAFGADDSRSLMLNTSAPGRLDKLHFVDWPDYHANDTIPPDQIEVAIKATGLNFRDVMVAMGEVAAATFGHEGAGVITRVGADVKDVKVGDRMLVLSALHGTFQTHTRTPREIAARIPDDMDFATAAGVPVIFATAHYCLSEVARLKKGETVLIHAAAGGVGQAAIQLAKNIGATVYATVSSVEKRRLLVEEYGIPEEHIFSSRDLSFAAGVMRITAGRGVDVILNSLAGEALRASFNCIATFGRFIEIGKRDIFANGRLDMFPFSRSVMFAACDLYTITKLDTKTTAKILAEVLDMWSKGAIHAAKPMTVYGFGEIEEAFRLLQQGKHMGKVVLTAGEEDVVKVIPKPSAPTRLRPDATYLLPGGLGGLGRSIAKWMAAPDQGAKNLVFLSRSSGEGEAAQELLRDLDSLGVRAKAIKCDISDEISLASALKTCEEEGFPKIAGVIQGAMQLKVSTLEHESDLTIFFKPTNQSHRTPPLSLCPSPPGMAPSPPRFMVPGIFINNSPRTWTSSSCSLPSAVSSVIADSLTTPRVIPFKMLWQLTVSHEAWRRLV